MNPGTTTKPPEDYIDGLDYKAILCAVLEKAVDDYIKLQHPANRSKTYLYESFLTAIDFLFDPTYQLANFDNGEYEDMSLKDLLCEIMDTDTIGNSQIKKLQAHAISQAHKYWENKNTMVLDHIPDEIMILGKVYHIHHADIPRFIIDEEEHILTINKNLSEKSQKDLIEAIITIICLEGELVVKNKVIKQLSKELLWVLKVNNCFTAIGLPKASEITTSEDPKS